MPLTGTGTGLPTGTGTGLGALTGTGAGSAAVVVAVAVGSAVAAAGADVAVVCGDDVVMAAAAEVPASEVLRSPLPEPVAPPPDLLPTEEGDSLAFGGVGIGTGTGTVFVALATMSGVFWAVTKPSARLKPCTRVTLRTLTARALTGMRSEYVIFPASSMTLYTVSPSVISGNMNDTQASALTAQDRTNIGALL